MRGLIERLCWLGVIGAYYKNRLALARSRFDHYSARYSLRRFQRAFDATLTILERRYEEAKEKFAGILAEGSGANDENDRYIDYYCRYYLSLANKDGREQEWLAACRSCSPDIHVRRALPLYHGPLPDQS